jgi:hypothetical protein
MPRKKLLKAEKKKVIWIFVKKKNHAKAKAAAKEIERKYNSEENKIAV